MNTNEIINRAIKNVLLEMDLVPTDSNNEPNLVKNQSVNAWKMIYRLMDNVKLAMEYKYQDKKGKVTKQDVNDITDYIYNGIENVIRNTNKNQ